MARIISALFALVALTQWPAFASAQSLSDSQAATRYVGEITQPYQQLLGDLQVVLIDTGLRIDEAVIFLEEGASASEIEKWRQSWVPQGRRELARIRSTFEALPQISPEELRARLTTLDPSGGIAQQVLRNRALVENTIVSTETFFNDISTLAPIAASGDLAAAEKLGGRAFTSARTILTVENSALEDMIAGAQADSPMGPYTKGMLAGNLVVVEYLTVLEQMMARDTEPSLDEQRQMIAGAIQRSAVIIRDGRQALGDANRQTSQILAELAAARGEEDLTQDDRRVIAQMSEMFTNFEQAIWVEQNILTILEGYRPESVDALAASFADSAAIERLVNQRQSLALERTRILTQ